MGYDMTYHLFAPEEVKSIYFDGVVNPNHFRTISAQFGLDEFYTDKLRSAFETARNTPPGERFQSTHAYYIAAIAGHLRDYWYIRGALFSTLVENPAFRKYTIDWRMLVPDSLAQTEIKNCVVGNYSGGVFLSNTGLKSLRADYESDSAVRAGMDEEFSHDRLAVFWLAADAAINSNLGLIEAADLMMPDPWNQENFECYCDVHHCQVEGWSLYSQAAAEQIAAYEQATKQSPPQQPPPKKGMFARLFGKKN